MGLSIHVKKNLARYQNLFWGALVPFGFAPFDLHAFLWLGVLFFYLQLEYQNSKKNFQSGYLFGIGLHLIGTSWIDISIHEYGHVHAILAAFMTMLFVLLMASFYGLMSVCYQFLKTHVSPALRPLFFASTWCLSEYLRAHFMGGFPWLMLGFSALKTPFEKVLPYCGVYGPSFVCTLALAYLGTGILEKGLHRLTGLLGVFLFMLPAVLPQPADKSQKNSAISVSIIQGNVAMQDKWDEQLFWQQFYQYLGMIEKSFAPQRLIILPEAAFAIPSSYLHDELLRLDLLAQKKHSALIFGIPQSTGKQYDYYNSMMALGEAKGHYLKQQLVPFGEYIPNLLLPLIRFLEFPLVNTLSGPAHQKPIRVFNKKIASLICYELAYPEHLRHQLPQGEFIISVSDDGWFGHSLALYQHLQMARTLSYMSHREQIFANNNGLSSLINAEGQIIKQLPAWKTSQINVHINSHDTITAWMQWGDQPILILCLIILAFVGVYHVVQIRRLSTPIILKIDEASDII